MRKRRKVKESKRKYDLDSMNKKLKTDCLNYLSSLCQEKDLFSYSKEARKEKEDSSIGTNKIYNQNLIRIVIFDALKGK